MENKISYSSFLETYANEMQNVIHNLIKSNFIKLRIFACLIDDNKFKSFKISYKAINTGTKFNIFTYAGESAKRGGRHFFFKGGGNLKGGGTFLKGGDRPPLHTMSS